MSVVLGANTYRTNADLIGAVRQLDYINDDSYGVDVTYGRGTWWKKWAPERLMVHDLCPTAVRPSVDFRRLPYPNNLFDFIAFDPPYVAVGGRKTSTIPAFNEAYGLDGVPKTVKGLHKLIVDGLLEAHRVLVPKGLVLMKSMSYVTSGQYTRQGEDAIRAVADFFRVKDELLYLRTPGPQPTINLDGSARIQRHARRNFSTLHVLEAIK